MRTINMGPFVTTTSCRWNHLRVYVYIYILMAVYQCTYDASTSIQLLKSVSNRRNSDDATWETDPYTLMDVS